MILFTVNKQVNVQFSVVRRFIYFVSGGGGGSDQLALLYYIVVYLLDLLT